MSPKRRSMLATPDQTPVKSARRSIVAISSSTTPTKEKSRCLGASRSSGQSLSPSTINLYDTLITIKVGDEGKIFSAHSGLVCEYLPFVKKYLRENDTAIIPLPELDVDTFDVFFTWIYMRQLPASLQAQSTEPGKRLRLAKLWVFGHEHCVPDLRNAAADALFASFHVQERRPSRSLVNWIYKSTLAKSPLRKIVVDYIVDMVDDLPSLFDPASSKSATWPKDFCCEVFFHFTSTYGESGRDILKSTLSWERKDACEYHIHEGPGGPVQVQDDPSVYRTTLADPFSTVVELSD